MPDREFWMMIRQALLMALDTMERMLNIEPRTAELRKAKRAKPAAGDLTFAERMSRLLETLEED